VNCWIRLAQIRELVFIIDGSEVGQECITLMISLIVRQTRLADHLVGGQRL
jgi:hypothetical protein